MADPLLSMYQFTDAGRITTVQGIPFRGHRHLGLPLAGAADQLSLALANWLVGNAAEKTAYEITLASAKISASNAAFIAVAGAADYVLIDGVRQPAGRSFILQSDQTLEIAAPRHGCRSYLVTCGGIPCSRMLGASSTYAPLHPHGSAYVADGYLAQGFTSNTLKKNWKERELPAEYALTFGDHFLLRYVAGPEHSWLESDAQRVLQAKEWTVSQRGSRMGQRLEGTQLEMRDDRQMDSSAVFPGTIQCPPSGTPFLLGCDAQTTGGYPRIAQIIRADRHLIGQLRPGAKVKLQRIEPAEARRLYRSKIALLRELQPDIRLD